MAAVDIYLAGLPSPLWKAEALKSILHVDAGPTLSTGVGCTLVRVFSAGGPCPACRTVTLKPRWYLVAGAPVGTRVRHTGVFRYLTVFS